MSPLTATDPAQSNQAWSEEALFDQAEGFFQDLLHGIDRAVHSVDLETYIFDDDLIGNQIIAALKRAKTRGVTIRLLMDGVGSFNGSHRVANKLETSGIEVKIFHPLPWQIHHYHRSVRQGDWLNKFLYLARRINHRDHRKLCLVDGNCLWTGSFNLSSRHLPLAQGGSGQQDYGLRVKGPIVGEIACNFDDLWNRRRVAREQGLFHYYWNNLTQSSRHRKNQLLRLRIAEARERVWIISAYFAPSNAVVNAIKTACSRGADVRVIVPQRSDIKLFPSITATYYADLLKAGAKIYQYLPTFLHAKALMIDDLFLIGSTNFNHRSFLHDLELDIQLHRPASKTQLTHWFLREFKNSQQLTSYSVSKRSLAARSSQALFSLFAKAIRYWF